MKEVNSVQVVIDGEVYELASEDNPEYVQNVALYIDTKIKDIYKKRSGAYINQKTKSLLISLNIADDLFKERDNNLVMKKEVEELNESLSEYMEENAKLAQDISILLEQKEILEKELFNKNKELKEFLENF
ncbi:MAG: cell division protein ZapA [Defluviitaleaceae bacterium]|nr:cell division protein ZapA [Defluviitaleaceae bacterium]